MSDLLSIGASGVRGYQTALTTVSENIANTGNAGYARRSATLSEVATSGVKGINGFGVLATGVARASDAIKSAAVRTAGADLARTSTGVTWLEGIETSLTGADLGARLSTFYTSATALAADPSSTAQRQVMLENATAVADGFTATGKSLDQLSADLDATTTDSVTGLNALATALAKVNEGLGRSAAGSTSAASLADQRDRILEQMSGLADVAVSLDAAGRANVNLGGSTGPALVTNGMAQQVSWARNDEGAVAFAVVGDGAPQVFVPQGGALAGAADAIAKVSDARSALATLATDFATGVNAVQAQGRDLDNQPGAAMFAVGADAGSGTAAMTVTLADPAGIAAASVGGGTRDASNLAALADTRTGAKVEARLTALVTGNAAAIAGRRTVADAQTAILSGATTARDQVSAVDLDNEAVDLLRFQQAYQASSRVIQAAKEIFDSILAVR